MRKIIGFAMARQERMSKIIPGLKMKLFFSGTILVLTLSAALPHADRAFDSIFKNSDSIYTLLGRRLSRPKVETLRDADSEQVHATRFLTSVRRNAESVGR